MATASAADLALKSQKLCFSQPQTAIVQTFGRLFADRKSIENLTPQKATQNLKNLTPERPNVDFGMLFEESDF